MTGLSGGELSRSQLDDVFASMTREPWYERVAVDLGSATLGLIHHGDRDRLGWTVHEEDDVVGLLYGAISNRPELELGEMALFERLLEQPTEVLERIDGQFLVAVGDRRSDRLVVATDKLGSRPCYYATRPRFAFGSELKAPLVVLDEPTVDGQAVSDMLLLGHMWGQRTLIEEIRALPPASVLTHEDGEIDVARYWQPSYEPREPSDQYLYELVQAYQHSVDRTATTLSGTAGLWLSGGLDSRATAAELQRTVVDRGAFEELRTYTYDGNPAGGGNPELAASVADVLGVDNAVVPLTPEATAARLDRMVDLTDGMVQWNTLLYLDAVHHLPDDAPGVVMEGIAGELIGHHLRYRHFTDCDSVVQSQYESEAARDADAVRELLTYEVDPFATLRAEARRTDEETFVGKVLDVHYQNYYHRMALASNHLARARVGTRVPYVDAELLEHAARLPLGYRMRTVPFTRGKIPYGATVPKLKLVRSLNTALARIPYERTGVPPTWPLPAHVAGFVARTSLSRLRGEITYGGPSMVDVWYRENETFRETVDELLVAASDRPFFDPDAIRRLRDAHLAGEGNHVGTLAAVTTLESWFQQHLDGSAHRLDLAQRSVTD